MMTRTIFIVQLPFPSLDYFPEPRYFALEQEWFRVAAGKDFTIPKIGIWELPWWMSWVSGAIEAGLATLGVEAEVRMVELSRVRCDLQSVMDALPESGVGDLFCFSPLTQNFLLAKKVATELRGLRRKCAIGGPMATHATLDCFDHIFVGRIETQLPGFMQWLAKALSVPESSRPLTVESLAAEIDHSWAPPSFHTETNYLRTFTVHGCPFACSFCADRLSGTEGLNKKLLLADLSSLASVFKQRTLLYIGDLTFGVLRPSMVQLKEVLNFLQQTFGKTFRLIVQTNAALITPRFAKELVDLNVAVVEMGIESGSPQAVRRTEKYRPSGSWLEERIRILHDHGIEVAGNIVVGLPDDAETEFLQTEEFIFRWRKKMWFHIYGFVPYPNTPLYERLVRDNRIIDWDTQKWCEGAECVFRPYNISAEKANQWLRHLLAVAVGDQPDGSSRPKQEANNSDLAGTPDPVKAALY